MPTDPSQIAPTSIDAGDAAELVELLTFLGDWFDSGDAPALNASLQQFAHTAYDLADLQTDLARFAFLLGGEGDRVFGDLA